MNTLCEKCNNSNIKEGILISGTECYTCIDYCNWDLKKKI